MALSKYRQSLGTFQTVHRSLKQDPLFSHPAISKDAKLLAVWLLISPDCGPLGFFQPSLQAEADSLGLAREDVVVALEELAEHSDFIYFDRDSGRVVIQNYVKWNPPESEKQTKSFLSALATARRRKDPLYDDFLARLEVHSHTLRGVLAPSVISTINEMVDEYVRENNLETLTCDEIQELVR